MDDLTANISRILNDPESMRQLQNVVSSLGLGNTSQPAAEPQPTIQQDNTTPNNTPDLSVLLSALSKSMPQNQPTPAVLAPSNSNAGGNNMPMPDLSGLLSMLGAGASSQANASQPDSGATGGAGSPDLSSILSALTSSQSSNSNSGSGGGDLSNILSALGGAQGTQNAAPNNNVNTQALGALSSLLGQNNNTQNNEAQSNASTANGNGLDVSALANLLGGNQETSGGSGLPNIDFNTILKIQKAMSGLTQNRENVNLLLALKPRLKPERAKKVDDAIKVMQLIQFLPLLKESGLFSGLDGLLGNLGGLGNLGNLGSIGSNLLSQLNPFARR